MYFMLINRGALPLKHYPYSPNPAPHSYRPIVVVNERNPHKKEGKDEGR